MRAGGKKLQIPHLSKEAARGNHICQFVWMSNMKLSILTGIWSYIHVMVRLIIAKQDHSLSYHFYTSAWTSSSNDRESWTPEVAIFVSLFEYPTWKFPYWPVSDIVWFKKTVTHLLLYTVANVSPFFWIRLYITSYFLHLI